MAKESSIIIADILGYKNMIKAAYKSGGERLLLQTIRAAMERVKREQGDPSGVKWQMKIYSDNLIVGYPFIGCGTGEFEFLQALFNGASLQLGLAAEHGIFIRGAILIGSIHISEELVFGKALIEANEADRNTKGAPPRIVLLPSAINFLRIKGLDSQLISRVVWSDCDGALYLNYMQSLSPPHISQCAELVMSHKGWVEQMLNKNNTDIGISRKYIWVAAYHNRFCSDSGYYGDNFMIRS